MSFSQHRRLDRLRSLLSLHPAGVSLYDLANLLQVDPRTVRRYLKEIERHYDLAPVRPRGGGPCLWRIHPRELPRKVEMRRNQVYALLAARRIFDALRGSALFDEIDLVIGRLMSFADRPGRGPNAGLQNARLEQRFVYLPRRLSNYSDRSMELDELFHAVSELRPLDVRYREPASAREANAGTAARDERLRIHPYALVLYGDAVYCVGRDVVGDTIRTLPLEGLRQAEVVLDERFALPADFRVEEHFRGELGLLEPSCPQRVVIDLSRAAGREVRERKIHPSQRLSTLAGGGLRLRLKLEDPLSLVSWVLGWGDEARVIEPEPLALAVRERLQAALAQYSGSARRAKRIAAERARG